MLLIEEPLPGVLLLEQRRIGDERGYFTRCYCAAELAGLGVDAGILQGNLSFSATAGTLRGMHYQLPPSAEYKIVQCVQGAVFDVVIDLREKPATFGRWIGRELSAANGRIMVIPPGCAHGFITLCDDVLVHYLVSAAYAPEAERGIRHDDPAFAIDWPRQPTVISKRDLAHPDFDPSWHLAAS